MMTISRAMEPHLVQEFVRRLDAARSQVFRTVATTDAELATLEAHQAGSPSEDAPKEAATAILSRLEGHEKHELDEIAAARARLAAGTYGACDGCHRAIPLARLRAMPAARYCVACQHREER
jgi:RNA polymerase-binding transcription factor DksA